MIRKSYVLTLEITVTVDHPRDSIALIRGRRVGRISGEGKEDKEARDRQQRLYEAVVSYPDIVENLCRCYAIDSVEDGLMHDLRKQLDVKEDEDVVLPAIKSLSQPDQKYWERIVGAGFFPENSELISSCIRPRLLSARIHKVDMAEHSRGE